MFERFTDRARRVIVLAQDEARDLRHNYIGTEHLLLGVIRDGQGVGARALTELGVTFEDARREVEDVIGLGGEEPSGHVPFTPRAKKVLELSLGEARQLGQGYIGTEHILLGIVREGDGVAAQILQKRELTLPVVRQAVLQVMGGSTGGQGSAAAQAGAGVESAGGFVEARPFGWTRYASRVGRPQWRSHRRRRGMSGRAAVCLGCGADLTQTAAYRILPVPELDGDGVVEMRLVFCSECGATITGHVLSEDPGEEAGGGELPAGETGE
jgi:hypothetical protein